jgi:20S proteasome subunit beta 6
MLMAVPDINSMVQPQQRQFNPYSDNGGTILAIAGADFTVIAGDTRQSEGYNIQTRYAPKVFKLYVHRASDPAFARAHHVSGPIALSWR